MHCTMHAVNLFILAMINLIIDNIPVVNSLKLLK